jgi:hypothetical protein
MIIVTPNLTHVTDSLAHSLYSQGRQMNPQTAAKTSTSGTSPAALRNDQHIAAVVEAAYLLDLTRR